MSIFDLIFIAVFFITVIMLITTGVAAIRGRRRRAIGTLRVLEIFIAAYLAVVIVVSLASPQRVLSLKEPRCFDDWCFSVDDVRQTPAGADVTYEVALRLFSRARGISQRENGGSVYVLDDRGRRYDPVEDPQAVPINVLLEPGESVLATRRFTLPADAHHPGLVFVHGRFPGMFIIGSDESLFHRPTVVRLP